MASRMHVRIPPVFPLFVVMNMTAVTTAPIQSNNASQVTPEFIRLPKPSTLCSRTGLSRSKMNELVLPSELNGFKPPVRSLSLRNRGQTRAVRLIVFDSLISYLRSLLEQQAKDNEGNGSARGA